MIGLMLALAAAAPAPLQFDHLPLGSAARVLSARFHVPITLLARPSAPISGDFSKFDLPHALAELARQTGLAVAPQGQGFVIGPDVAPAAPAAKAPPPAPAIPLAQQREALLRRREELFEAAAAGR